MKHIKKINEEDTTEDLLDLFGDLNNLGYSKLQGWVFAWDSKTEDPLVEVMITNGPREALEMYEIHGYFGADIKYAQKEGKTFKKLDEVFKYLQQDEAVSSYQFVWGMNIIETVKEAQFITVSNSNPFIVTDLLNRYFDNAAERYRREYNPKITKVKV